MDAINRLAGHTGKPVLVLGRAGMDFYAEPPGTRIAEARAFMPALGGSAANIAVALVKQGVAANLLTCVSGDAVGDYVLAELVRYGVGTAHVARSGGANSLAVVETRVDAANVLYRRDAADIGLSGDHLTGIDWPAHAALVITGTALSADPSRTATQEAVAQARTNGLPVIIDLDYRPRAWTDDAASVLTAAAGAADIVIGNDEEFAVLAGGSGGLPLAAALAESRIVVYKMGGAGAITLAGGIARRSGVFPVRALKPTGAGDAFLGGFLAALMAGHALPAAVRQGSATAAITVTRPGCAPALPDSAELTRFLQQHPTGP